MPSVMQESSWDEQRILLQANGQETMSNAIRLDTNAVRSQEDSRGVLLARPPNDISQQFSNKRWAVSEEASALDQALTVSEIEREFHRMAFENAGVESDQRKLWNESKGGSGDGPNGMFAPLGPNNPWMNREDWGATNPADHGLSDLIHVSQRGPGGHGPFPNPTDLPTMSPHLTDTSNLGVNMAEYVLGTSPMGKELEPRIQSIHRYVGTGDGDGAKISVEKAAINYDGEMTQEQKQEAVHLNGKMTNGLDDKSFSRAPGTGSRQNSPTEVDSTNSKHPMSESLLHNFAPPGSNIAMSSLSLDVPPFEATGYDLFHPNFGGNQMVAAVDSPNFVDYSQQMMQMRQQQQQQQQHQQQQQMTMMPQQQYALSADQMLGMTAYVPPACVINSQDSYTAVGMPMTGPAVVPPYYGMPTSWPIYPNAGMMQQQPQQQPPPQQQQQQQQMGQQTPKLAGTPQPFGRQNTRPMTPQQMMQDGSGMAQMHTPGGTPSGYQILTPAYYDQSGQLMMGSSRGLGPLVRLVSPAPLMVNTAGAGPGQQGYTPSAGMFTPASTGMFNPRANTTQILMNTPGFYNGMNTTGVNPAAGLLAQQQQQQQRRDSGGSQDFKQLQPMASYNQYYCGPMDQQLQQQQAAFAAQTMTPPPALPQQANNQMSLAGLNSGGRLYSAAPGAETKFRNGTTVSLGSSIFGTSLFNNQAFAKGDGVGKDVTGRSQLLEDFRSNRIPSLQLRDLANHVVEFSQDQHGSRFIQQKLEHAVPAEKLMVFNEILSAAYGLMTDVFGNYVIQKFFEFGNPEQKQTLAQRVRGHVLALALHMYGCRVIQKALESIPPEMQVELVKELDGHLLKCVKDQNGNHVVQKCIETINSKHLVFITDAFKGQVMNLAMHPYGCRVIQRILEHCSPEQVNPIMEELLQQTEHLVHDQYGNYVIQHVLEHGQPEDKSKIINQLRGKIMILSQHKFASNVIEKCVTHSSRTERAFIIEEVCSMTDGPQSALYTMMKDQFANYVVQKMIDVADPAQRQLLIRKIRPHVALLRRYAYGKHILAKLEKYYIKSNAELGPIGVAPAGSIQ